MCRAEQAFAETEIKGWLVTGSRMFKDRIYTNQAEAQRASSVRNDGSIVVPLSPHKAPSQIFNERLCEHVAVMREMREAIRKMNTGGRNLESLDPRLAEACRRADRLIGIQGEEA